MSGMLALDGLQGAQVARERERFWRRRAFHPRPRITLSEWSDKHRVLTREGSAEAGQWRTDRAPYQRGIQDALSNPTIEKVVWQKSSQIGATEILCNLVGYVIDQDPGPILIVQPTEQMAKAVSTDRLSPMIKSARTIREKVHASTGGRRDAGDTMLYKTFSGGHLTLTTARSAASLASRPIRFVMLDELDRYPESAGDEGRPEKLAERRTANFWNRKIYIPSTPTIKGRSRIEAEFERTDQRRYFVPCPHCGHRQHLRFPQLTWDKDAEGVHRWETAAYVCEACAALIEESDKASMLAAGEWVATNAAHRDPKVVGFHLNALYSPWTTWAQIAKEFLEAKSDPMTLRTFVNTYLGETFEEKAAEYEPSALARRCEPYAAEVPREVALLTAFVDVQGDRLEVQVVGWGPGEESWLILYDVVLGDPGGDAVWEDVDRILTRGYLQEGGGVLRIRATGVDSGGHHTDNVYAFVRARRTRRLYATKGHSVPNQPIWPDRAPKAGKKGVKVYLVGVDTAKDLILISRLRKLNAEGQPSGPGAMHFPEGTSEEYFAGLASEVKKAHKIGGKSVYRWAKIRERNEPLDLWVGCLAALRSLGRSVYDHLDRELERVRKAQEVAPERAPDAAAPTLAQQTPQQRRPPNRGRGGWAQGWRR